MRVIRWLLYVILSGGMMLLFYHFLDWLAYGISFDFGFGWAIGVCMAVSLLWLGDPSLRRRTHEAIDGIADATVAKADRRTGFVVPHREITPGAYPSFCRSGTFRRSE